jgi:hypothetical protein
MRLYEFTDPRRYLLPKNNAADLVKRSKNIKTADTNDTVRNTKEKPEIKNHKDIL